MPAVRVRVTGAVQGVGFRPFCYSEAVARGLAGFVLNDLGGVKIVLEGSRKAIDGFLKALRTTPPPASRIRDIVVEEVEEQGFKDFTIRMSEGGQASQALEVSADLATCRNCRREILDLSDRRAGYAFTNCTDCGPRYTIIDKLPYDRPLTSMGEFSMCTDCRSEYENPLDRRFHAQPNACPSCGPELLLLDNTGRVVRTGDVLGEAARLLANGKILAVKGLGGYHLMCDAGNSQAVKELRKRKARPSKAFALMARDIESASSFAEVGLEEQRILESASAPIVLLKWKQGVSGDLRQLIAPRNPGVGIMLAYTPLHHLLFAAIDKVSSKRDTQEKLSQSPQMRDWGPHRNTLCFYGALVATSANRGDEPLIADEVELFEKLGGVFDFALVHNRKILNRIDDSIGFYLQAGDSREETSSQVRLQEGEAGIKTRFGEFHLVRRARGYAPQPFETGFNFPRALAVGAEMKGSFAISDGSRLWLSPHIGELTNLETIEFFEETLERYLQWFRVEPGIVVRDMHPDYLTSRWAEQYSREKGVPLLDVQHHHAHIASVIFEHRLEEAVIGLSLDGTGYGINPTETWEVSAGAPKNNKEGYRSSRVDAEQKRGEEGRSLPKETGDSFGVSSIWGCELLHVTDAGACCSRLGHMRTLALVGGERAIRNPRKMAAGVISDFFGREKSIELFGELGERASVQLDAGLGVVRASSAGRLFDTVAGLLGLVDEITFEAEGAIALEALAASVTKQPEGYRFDISDDFVLDPLPCLEEIIVDLEKGTDKAEIAARFHTGFTEALLIWAAAARDFTECNTVASSGGVFANRLLLGLLRGRAQSQGFEFRTQVMIPSSDGGLAAGQLQIAAALARLGRVEK